MSSRQKRLRGLADIHEQLQAMAERHLAEARRAREQTLAAIRDVETLSGYNLALDDLLTANAVKTLARLRSHADLQTKECAARHAKVLDHFKRGNLIGKLSARIAATEARQEQVTEAGELTASLGLASLPQETIG